MNKQAKRDLISPNYSLTNCYSIDDVKRLHTKYFFSKDSMRFFNSRLVNEVYPSNHGKVYFITSEKYDYKSPRLFTLRAIEVTTGNIDIIGEFQAYTSKSTAETMALNYAAGLVK